MRTRTVLSRLRLNIPGMIGALSVIFMTVIALLAAVWTPTDPFLADPYGIWQSPSFEHPLGTDAAGRDLLSYLMRGTTTAMIVALGSTIIAAMVGVALAIGASVTRSQIRDAITVAIDVAIAFPVVMIAMVASGLAGGSLLTVILAIGIGFGVNIARVLRGELRRIATRDYIAIARVSGISRWRILIDHLLPGVAPVMIIQFSWTMGLSILAEAGLSYLGYGAGQETASWGRMLSELQTYLSIFPLSVFWPGLFITVTVLGFTLLGDGLRDTLATHDRENGR